MFQIYLTKQKTKLEMKLRKFLNHVIESLEIFSENYERISLGGKAVGSQKTKKRHQKERT